MSYIIGVIIGGALIAALYELLVLPLLVGKPRALWGRWPVEAQSDVYERGFQAATERAIQVANEHADAYERTLLGVSDNGLRMKAAEARHLAEVLGRRNAH